MKTDTTNRRQFMERSAAMVGSLALSQHASSAERIAGANERIRLASIGVGGQGTFHLRHWASMEDVEVVAVCDVDPSHVDRAYNLAGSSPKKLKDFREVLDMKDVDAICIAAPDHWHAIMTIQACQAGKAVYVEKPIGHNIKEGRAIADAARKHNVVVQHGTQQRSGPHWANAVARIKAGELGKISMIHAWNAWNPQGMFGNLGRPADGDPPKGVDYDMWLGPAPERPFNPLRFHRTFYFFWDYSGGMISAWAVHLFDIVMWAMGSELRSVDTIGGQFVHDDARDTPDTATAVFECPGYDLHYSMRHGNNRRPHGERDHGIEFFGTKATLQINRLGFEIHDEGAEDRQTPRYTEKKEQDSSRLHKRRFLDCVRGKAKPLCDAETGHLASIYGHLANIAYRVGRRVRWDAKTELIVNDAEAEKLLGRVHREPWHL